MNYTSHYSVLKKECLTYLSENSKDKRVYADLTFGGGGHTFALALTHPDTIVHSTDQDPEALANGYQNIESLNLVNKVFLHNMNFNKFPEFYQDKFLESHGPLNGVLMDLGVSSHHFDSGERGFSFRHEAPLDMRMNNASKETPTAAFILETYSEDQLISVFKEYGEEKYAYRIAKKIVESRIESPIKTTTQLEDIIFHCYPKKERHGKTSPSTKCFQALRIEVNQELKVLSDVIPRLLSLLDIGGRLAIISFHSLEDRIVKRSFKNAMNGDLHFEILTKKPIIPTEGEILENSRSRSAKLRIIERVAYKKTKNKYAHLKSSEE